MVFYKFLKFNSQPYTFIKNFIIQNILTTKVFNYYLNNVIVLNTLSDIETLDIIKEFLSIDNDNNFFITNLNIMIINYFLKKRGI